MSTINAYGLDAVAPYVLALQMVGAAIMFGLGRWRSLGWYLVALLPIWFFSLMLYSAHCLACGEGIWFVPGLIVIVAVVARIGIVSRLNAEKASGDDA